MIKKLRGSKFERLYWIQEICDDFLSSKEFSRVLKETNQLFLAEIKSIYLEAQSWEIFSSDLFWKLLKERNEVSKTK